MWPSALAAGSAASISQVLLSRRKRLHEAGDAPGAREKLATVAAALDTIRLDLLRVRAGALSAMELTEQIAVVSRVHDQIQDHEEAEAQIGRLLRGHTPTPA
jgi:hypothetical protein